MSAPDLDEIERLAKALITPRDGGPPRTGFNDRAPPGCVNLWAERIPLAVVQHPEAARYLAALSPGVVLALVAEVRRLRADLDNDRLLFLARTLPGRLMDEKKALEEQRWEAVRRAQALGVDLERATKKRDEARAEVARLKAALADYGQHLVGTNNGPPCPKALSYDPAAVCTCGLEEALACTSP